MLPFNVLTEFFPYGRKVKLACDDKFLQQSVNECSELCPIHSVGL